MARQVGHHGTAGHLRQVYGELGIVHGVVMGNYGLDVQGRYPADLFHYCVGLDSGITQGGRAVADLPDRVEEHLRRDSCCGVKLYPGYNRISLSDPLYEPIYRLAARYGKPVAVHMGLTSFPQAHLKYCHPLALDEAAADHPDTRFVMCHFGNPFLESAAAVVEKNPNVAADLSGLLEGRVDLDALLPGAGGLCVPAARLARRHPVLGQADVRHRLAHRQPGGIYRLCCPAGAGAAPRGGVL